MIIKTQSSESNSPAALGSSRVDDFRAAYERMVAEGIQFMTAPRVEPYGEVAVFLDLEGNRWDLLGPVPGE